MKLALGVVWTACAYAAAAGAQPSAQPVRVVVPLPPGGSSDLTARAISAKLSEMMSRTFVVDNRTGAAGQIGIQTVARAAPDGNTLVVTPSGPISITGHLQKLPYDPIADLVPVAMFAHVPSGIAVPAASPIRSLQDMLAAARRSGSGLTYSVSGLGIHMHLAGELLSQMTGAPMRPIPYRGTSPATAAIMSGDVDAGISDLSTLLPLAKSGRLRILAVTDTKRTITAPDIPTVAEEGVRNYSADAWIGMFAPAGTPPEVVAQLNAAVAKALEMPDVKATFFSAGLEPFIMNPEEMSRFIKGDYEKWGALIKKAQIKID
jgi:tripartite-type tricarboxylate transporter receptor subunit TctC